MDIKLYTAVKVAMVSVLRIFFKTLKRWRSPLDKDRIVCDENFLSLSSEQQEKLIDQVALKIAEELKLRLEAKYKSRLKAVFMYGSRVRGDYCEYSDLDIALFFDFSIGDYDNIKQELLSYTMAFLMRYGIYIQMKIYDDEIRKSHKYPDYLAKAALTYGISL
jgi:predicted nucleotidyltransferase